MKINKWIGKLNLRIEIRWKRHYKHSIKYMTRKLTKYSLIYGSGIGQVSWDVKKPWQFWKNK